MLGGRRWVWAILYRRYSVAGLIDAGSFVVLAVCLKGWLDPKAIVRIKREEKTIKGGMDGFAQRNDIVQCSSLFGVITPRANVADSQQAGVINPGDRTPVIIFSMYSRPNLWIKPSGGGCGFISACVVVGGCIILFGGRPLLDGVVDELVTLRGEGILVAAGFDDAEASEQSHPLGGHLRVVGISLQLWVGIELLVVDLGEGRSMVLLEPGSYSVNHSAVESVMESPRHLSGGSR